MLDCPSCGHPNREGAKFCEDCATPLTPTPPSRSEERKVVTVLFCDLVGFTASSERVDPEDVRARIDPYFARLRRTIESYGGTVDKYIGDAVMAVFGAPLAHEDDAERAVRCGLAILDEITDLNASDPRLALVVRVGVNTGEALVRLASPDKSQGIVTGDVVNTASRLQSAAPEGGIVVSETTYRGSVRAIEYEELPPVTAKGKARPIPVWRALRPRTASIGHSTPFVGREDDMAILQASYRKTLRERSLHVLTVVGEPGSGKTRLVVEFSKWLGQQEEPVTVRKGRCLPYGEGVTFWALGEILKTECGILESDGPEETDRKLVRTVEARVPRADQQWIRLRLAPLVGLPSSEPSDRNEIFTALQRFLEHVAADQPFVCVIEDLQWADPALLDFVEHLIEWVAEVPIFVVATARLELFEKRAAWGGGARNASVLALAPLSAKDCSLLVSALLGTTALRPEIEAAILERVEGNPLFAEEFVRLLTDRGLLMEAGEGTGLVPGAELPMPTSIASVISARLDTLPRERKRLLTDAAVMGAVFWVGAVVMLGERERESVGGALHELSQQELVRPIRDSSIAGESEFRFWHSLIRDVAYAQLPRVIRAERHRRAATWIESVAPERLEDFAELIAHHYTSALELAKAMGRSDLAAEVQAPALRYLILAGDHAMGLDFGRAEAHYRHALELAPPEQDEAGGRTRAELLMKLGWAAVMTGDLLSARTALEDAATRWQTLADPHQAGLSLAMLGRVEFFLAGDSHEAQECLREAILLLEPDGPSRELIRAHVWNLPLQYTAGHAREGGEQARQALAVDEALGGTEYRVQLEISLGGLEAMSGDPSGIERIRKALTSAEESGDVDAIARAHLNLVLSLSDLSSNQEGIVAADAGRRALRRFGTPSYEWLLAGKQAEMLVELGRFEDAIELAGEVLSTRREDVVSPAIVWAGSAKVLALLRLGRTEEAQHELDDVLDPARCLGGTAFLVPVLSAAAELHESAGDLAAARQAADEVATLLINCSATCAQVRALPLVARLLGAETTARLLEQIGPERDQPSFKPRLLEAQGVVENDPSALLMAAKQYGALLLPYDEARCRLYGKDADGSAAVLRDLGLKDGPLFRQLEGLSPV
jgi:class 3 adenylate cyclase/tetratricopeptide (TPR) repeat protein